MIRPTVEETKIHRWGPMGLMGCLLFGGSLLLALDESTAPSVVQTPSHLEVTLPPVITGQIAVGKGQVSASDEYMELASSVLRSKRTHESRPTITNYTVSQGDTVWLLSRRFGTDVNSLMALNPNLDTLNLNPGQEVRVVADFAGLVHRIQPGDSVEYLAVGFGLSAESIRAANDLGLEATLKPGEVVFLPGAKPRIQIASRGETARRTPSTSEPPAPRHSESLAWVWPISGGQFFSEFGNREDGFHQGLDIAAPVGTPVLAVQAGVVIFSGWDGGYGYCVILDHKNGLQTRYAHASVLLVGAGQEVNQGEAVIHVGTTGKSTGPHLHLEVLVDGTPVNPRHYLPE